jgi:predicted enzyme related to lactoylglutathione lyase
METPKNNVCGWFEIPVMDMDRAVKFYETVFEYKMHRENVGELDMAWFPFNMEAYGSPGSLALAPDFYKPSDQGTLVYLTANSGNLANEMGRVEAAGGKVEMEKKQISEEHGYMGVFTDSEGNRIAMHSRK